MAMTPYTRNMHQTATYWAPGMNDGMGDLVFGAPVLIKCRWQDKMTLIRDAQGRQVPSRAIVYSDRKLDPQGMIILGDLTNLTNPRAAGAMEILATGSSPSLRATTELHKVWL